ncbi:MAG TPA: hypothetical protein VFJ63_01105 [Candidatus Bathyarchaeia archaeon]|nr:hypothetical protein [Candidatus Bathyarchaeia archaeon]
MTVTVSDPEVESRLKTWTVKDPAPPLFRENEPDEGLTETIPFAVVAVQECEAPDAPPATFATIS